MRPLGQPAPRDPAPSRLHYRMQRWMLTPGIRLTLKLGLPLAVVAGLTVAVLADSQRRDQIVAWSDAKWQEFRQRPEFMVELMAIDGANPALADHIRARVPVSLPASSFDIDLAVIRELVSGMAPVDSAAARIRPGGVLQIDVTERVPAAVWRGPQGLALVDATGVRIATIASRADHPDLPLIAGRGAQDNVAEALRLTDAAAPLAHRLRGLVRVGQRRWDVVLDRGQRIMLPSERPQRALERVIALSEAQDMLDRDVAVVDVRLAERPTLRMSEGAVTDWWRIRGVEIEKTDG
ncbi:cell division protein FtsQ/DivIB [Pukyongiella litopenaei]|uniref:Cell division protein FtsQ n=1 Tax=Pukyongiella litopenaei TaxID=2605946 RepID=A0A2S0MLG4_9RHOB|nr:cell division protein FtsQ/DivIB [Pukyongiella litopenaei]AVO36712.1 cell division protein FtsQ [Pukyongiella litopenaei]